MNSEPTEETSRESGPEDGAEEVTLPASELNVLREKAGKADENWNRLLMANADFENSKKRLEKRSQDHIRFANEAIVKELLPVVDDLNRALSCCDEKHPVKDVKEGLLLVKKSFRSILEKHGVELIAALGEPFDPNMHEALGELPTDEVTEGHVAEEIQSGYKINGRLVRPSRVRIAKRIGND